MGQRNETKCYLVDHYYYNGLQASFVDLSGLYRKSGYEASNAERPDLQFLISVCQPIYTGGPCDNSMICLYSNDSQLSVSSSVNLPSPLALFSHSGTATPSFEGSDVVVTYPITAHWISAQCTSSAYVKIKFRCPSKNQVVYIYNMYMYFSL